MQACRFLVAGAALCNAAFFAFAWRAQHFVTCPKCFCHESQCQGCANMTQCQKSWQAQHLVTALTTCRSLAKNNTFGAL